MAEMAMIEGADARITWECSECKAEAKDKAGFETKVKKCPKCCAEITEFHSLFDDNGNYV